MLDVAFPYGRCKHTLRKQYNCCLLSNFALAIACQVNSTYPCFSKEGLPIIISNASKHCVALPPSYLPGSRPRFLGASLYVPTWILISCLWAALRYLRNSSCDVILQECAIFQSITSTRNNRYVRFQCFSMGHAFECSRLTEHFRYDN